MAENKRYPKWINDIVGIFTDPLVLPSPMWADTLPKWIKEAVIFERMIAEMEAAKTGVHLATEAEVVAHLYCAGLEAPLDYQFTNIYVYLVRRLLDRHKPHGDGFKFPNDMIIEKLNNYEQNLLDDLRLKIYNTRIRGRKSVNNVKEETGEKTKPEPDDSKFVQLGFDIAPRGKEKVDPGA